MKRFNFLAIIFLAIMIAFTSCSRDDDANISGDYFSITRNGEEYFKEEINYAYLGIDFSQLCSGRPDLTINRTEEYIETNEFSFSIQLLAPAWDEDMEHVSYLDAQIFTAHDGNNQENDCNYAYHLDLLYSENDRIFYPDKGANNVHYIQSVSKISEYDNEVVYAVKGSYQATMINSSCDTIDIKGDYNFYIRTFKLT
ncbi:hypothetical protein [uncultured Mesonia sp.]|uniref:hypothetical protein n=1 Tax=uncultured Mesonia sp. TaxID=399731 RepID=UPI00374F4CB7